MSHLNRRRTAEDFITEKFMNKNFPPGFIYIEDPILLFCSGIKTTHKYWNFTSIKLFVKKIIVSIFATAFGAITG